MQDLHMMHFTGLPSNGMIEECPHCRRFKAAYEHLTALRAQAEAHFMAAAYSRITSAVTGAKERLKTAEVVWRSTQTAFCRHLEKHRVMKARSAPTPTSATRNGA